MPGAHDLIKNIRTTMWLVGLVDFRHMSALGNAPAHKLFERAKVQGIKKEDSKFKSSGSEFPQGLHDYRGEAPGGVEKYEPVPRTPAELKLFLVMLGDDEY
jgi:hypothetical protein